MSHSISLIFPKTQNRTSGIYERIRGYGHGVALRGDHLHGRPTSGGDDLPDKWQVAFTLLGSWPTGQQNGQLTNACHGRIRDCCAWSMPLLTGPVSLGRVVPSCPQAASTVVIQPVCLSDSDRVQARRHGTLAVASRFVYGETQSPVPSLTPPCSTPCLAAHVRQTRCRCLAVPDPSAISYFPCGEHVSHPFTSDGLLYRTCKTAVVSRISGQNALLALTSHCQATQRTCSTDCSIHGTARGITFGGSCWPRLARKLNEGMRTGYSPWPCLIDQAQAAHGWPQCWTAASIWPGTGPASCRLYRSR